MRHFTREAPQNTLLKAEWRKIYIDVKAGVV